MKTPAKSIILSVAIAAATIAAISPASARDRYRDYRPRDYHHHHNNNDAVILGAAGLAAGVLLGTAIASQPRYVEPAPVYVEPEPVYVEREPVYVDPEPVYGAPDPEYYPVRPRPVANGGSLTPWSSAWYEYCSGRYRTFNPKTGTYVGYDGQRHFCSAG